MKDQILKTYIIQKLTYKQLANKYRCSLEYIINILKENNIKVCRSKKCENPIKTFDDFPKASRSDDGYSNECTNCRTKMHNIRKAKNPKKIKDYQTKYTLAHKAEKRIYDRKYEKQRLATDPSFKARHATRQMLKDVLKRGKVKKTKTTNELLGYSSEELMDNIESKFKSGMTWLNHGDWDIHHKKEVVTFSLANNDGTLNESELRKCNSLDNLIPLWKDEHIEIHKLQDKDMV